MFKTKTWLQMAALIAAASGPMACGGSGGAGAPDGGDQAPDAGSTMDAAPVAASAKAVVQETSIDFGAGECGGKAPAAKTVTIKNTGGAPLTWTAALSSSDAFELTGVSGGSIASGASAQVSIQPKAIPSSATAGQPYVATLTITTNDPSLASVSVPVSIAAHGATLNIVPATADFGTYALGQQAPDVPLTLTNTGNEDATVTFSTPTDAQFSVDWAGAPAAAQVAAQNTMNGLKARFKPTNTQATSASATIQVSGAGVCGTSATKVDLKGQGTSGALVYSPGTLDFGLTDCGSTAPSQTFTVTNNGNAPLTWAAVLSANAPYTLSSYGGVLAPSNQQIVTVTPTAIPFPSEVTPNLYGATVTLTTNAVNDTPHVITLEQTAHGAILTTSASTLDFGPNGKPGDTKSFTVNNVGNANATVTFSDNGGNFSVSPATNPVAIAGGANQPYTLTAEPQTLGALGSSVSIQATGVLCKSLPSATNVTGTMNTSATALSLRGWDSCAITPGNRAYCWGDDNNYLGHSWNIVGTRAYGFPSVTAIASDYYYYGGLCAANASGAVSCRSSTYTNDAVTPIANLGSGVSQLVTYGGDFCALKGGAVLCWTASSTTANSILASGATSIAMGYSYTDGNEVGVVMNDGTFWTGPTAGPLTKLTAFSNIASAKLGYGFGCALDTSGSVWCYGDNYYGAIDGYGSVIGGTATYDPSTPFKVNDTNGTTPITGALAIATGDVNTCLIRSDHTVVCFGYNCAGELGSGDTTCYKKGVFQAGSINDAQAISAGFGMTCVLRSGGAVSCWGDNTYASATSQNNVTTQASPFSIPSL